METDERIWQEEKENQLDWRMIDAVKTDEDVEVVFGKKYRSIMSERSDWDENELEDVEKWPCKPWQDKLTSQFTLTMSYLVTGAVS